MANDQSQAKREAQANLLLDEGDPTLNNPALDLEDSDVDDEWTTDTDPGPGLA